MNIDSLVSGCLERCLEKGQIHISSYSDEYLCATLDMYNKELFRVFSCKGANHLILLLASEALNDKSIEEVANKTYLYPLAPLSEERSNPLYRLALHSSISIFSTNGGTVHVEQYISDMRSLAAKPRPSSRTGLGSSLSEAIENIEKKDFTLVTCVSDKLE